MITILRVYKRIIAFLLVFLVSAYCVFLFIHPDNFGRFYGLFDVALTVILIASGLHGYLLNTSITTCPE
jgi:hypothetical protein